MQGSYRILPERGLVYVRYEGHIELDSSNALFARYQADPESHPGQKQLLDLSAVTSWEVDFPRLMAIQAKKLEALMSPDHDVILVCFAPNETAQEFARFLSAPWQGAAGMVVSVQHDEAGALAVLGQPETRIADLLDQAAYPARRR